MTAHSLKTLEDRIAAAFNSATKASDVRELIVDAEGACQRADEEAQHARSAPSIPQPRPRK